MATSRSVEDGDTQGTITGGPSIGLERQRDGSFARGPPTTPINNGTDQGRRRRRDGQMGGRGGQLQGNGRVRRQA